MNIFTDNVVNTLEKLSESTTSFDERDRLILSFPIYDVPLALQNDILDAYDYYIENPSFYDGTTGSSEQWASIYEPASMRHDLDYQTYGGTFKGRLYSDLKFLDIKKRYKVSALWRNIQYYAVRWGGYFFQFTNWVKGNTNVVPLDKQFISPIKRNSTQKVIEILGIVTIVPFVFFFLGAMVMQMKHKFSLGFKISLNWMRSTFKKYWNTIF